MRTMTMILLALAGVAYPTICSALTMEDLLGRWVISWPNNTRNAVTLTRTPERLAGVYISDDGRSCTATASLEGRKIAIQVACPDWDVRMEGQVAADGRTITGRYRAYIDSEGNFTMAR